MPNRLRQLAACCLLSGTALTAGAALFGKPAPVDFEAQVKPVLAKNCFGCHGAKKQKAGLSLESYGRVEDVRQGWKTWMQVLEQVKAGKMPPEERDPLPAADRDLIVRWLSRDMFPLDCARPDPGRITIRRLNRAEYDNTIRDLVGVDFHPAADFPDDSMAYGFDNNGDALSVSPLLLEKYLEAAGQILDRAITPLHARLPTRTIAPQAMRLRGSVNYNAGCCAEFYSEGVASFTAHAQRTAVYRLRILAYGQQAGDEPARMGLRIDDVDRKTFDVTATEDAPAWYEFEASAVAGEHTIALSFLNDFYNPSAPRRQGRDRNLYIQSVEVIGPLDEIRPPTESHRRIFVCEPSQGVSTSDCARRIVADFAARAFRRPVATNEVERLSQFALEALGSGESFEDAVKASLTAVLVSPSFLFRGEPTGAATTSGGLVDDFALASRLSYFLWSSMPDEELLRLAGQGTLRKQAVTQARRMLADPKSAALVENFAGQWLQIRNLEQASPDRGVFPAFTDQVRRSMRRETELLFDHVFRGGGDLLDFLRADYTFLDGTLAAYYGIPGVTGSEFRRVALSGRRPGGLLAHGSILTLTSNPTRTSPVKRGKWVLETVLNTPPPPPPPLVPALSEKKEDTAAAPLRERLAKHVADPICASCHLRMDPLGLAFEHYDGIGRWREKDGAFPIDDACSLPGEKTFVGVTGLRDQLVREHGDEFIRSIAERMLAYALGRGLEYYDACAVDTIVQRVKKRGNSADELVTAIVESVPFQQRR